jgi:hypothetical protein
LLRATGPHAIDPHWPSDIFQPLLARILQRDVELAAHLPLGVIGEANAAGLRYSLEARRHIHAIAEDVLSGPSSRCPAIAGRTHQCSTSTTANSPASIQRAELHATVCGDVTIGPNRSIGFGGVHALTAGRTVNVQLRVRVRPSLQEQPSNIHQDADRRDVPHQRTS